MVKRECIFRMIKLKRRRGSERMKHLCEFTLYASFWFLHSLLLTWTIHIAYFANTKVNRTNKKQLCFTFERRFWRNHTKWSLIYSFWFVWSPQEQTICTAKDFTINILCLTKSLFGFSNSRRNIDNDASSSNVDFYSFFCLEFIFEFQ